MSDEPRLVAEKLRGFAEAAGALTPPRGYAIGLAVEAAGCIEGLIDALRAARDDALEEAARACEADCGEAPCERDQGINAGLSRAAAAIRALMARAR